MGLPITGRSREIASNLFRSRVRSEGRAWRPRTQGTVFIGVFAGKGELTRALKDVGITCLARVDIEGQGALHPDVLKKSGKRKLLELIIRHDIHYVHFGTPCSSFSRALGPHLNRSKEFPLGLGYLANNE